MRSRLGKAEFTYEVGSALPILTHGFIESDLLQYPSYDRFGRETRKNEEENQKNQDWHALFRLSQDPCGQ